MGDLLCLWLCRVGFVHLKAYILFFAKAISAVFGCVPSCVSNAYFMAHLITPICCCVLALLYHSHMPYYPNFSEIKGSGWSSFPPLPSPSPLPPQLGFLGYNTLCLDAMSQLIECLPLDTQCVGDVAALMQKELEFQYPVLSPQKRHKLMLFPPPLAADLVCIKIAWPSIF